MTLALNTTMRKFEIQTLRWADVDMMDWTVSIRRSGTKTDAGARVIPLNFDAQRAIIELRDQAKAIFGEQLSPDWYLFPRVAGRHRPDPSRPVRGWTSAWRSLRKKAAASDSEKGIAAMPGLATFRFHDTRHHAITELAESQASDSTIRSIAGHVSQRMLDHYSHVRIEAKRRALDALSSRPGRVMSQTTSQTGDWDDAGGGQVIEKIGGPGGVRTLYGCLKHVSY